MKKRFLLITLIVLLISMLSACVTDIVRAEARVDSISVDGILTPYYFVGDELDLDDAILYVIYENGYEEQVPITKDMIAPSFNTDRPGKKTVVITYKGVSTSFQVEVLDLEIESVELLRYPIKTTYIEGTDLEVEGATLGVRFKGGRVVTVPVLSNNVTQYNPNRIGKQDVQITYRSEVLYIPIEIIEKSLVAISVNKLPSNKAVFVDHPINPLGMTLDFHYNNGKSQEIAVTAIPNHQEVIEFVFDNTKASPSTLVEVIYKESPNKEFKTTFRIQVLAKRWQSMRIIQYPVTHGILIEPAEYDDNGELIREEVRTPSTSINNIIQGDTLDLSTGIVEITCDDGSKQNYTMDDLLLRVYNMQVEEQAEIQGLTIEPIEMDKVPPGDCYLQYNVRLSETKYIYDEPPEIRVTAQNKQGIPVPVIRSGDRQLIEVEKGEVYTIKITATVSTLQEIDGVMQEVILTTIKSYHIIAEDGVLPRRRLDISTPGDYELTVIYMENPEWSVNMNVRVHSRRPISMELTNTDDVEGKRYVVGDRVNIAFVKYRMVYDNGYTDPWKPVTTRMLSSDVSLNCDMPTTPSNPKRITFTMYGITSRSLEVTVIPLEVVSLELEPPTNNYVTYSGTINPAGGVLTAYMNNNTKQVFNLAHIVGEGEDKAQIINDPDSEGNNIAREEPYIATLRYKGTETYFEYYVSDKLVDSLHLIRSGTEKTVYFENQPLDLRGLSLRVTWKGGDASSQIIPVTQDMVYRFDPYRLGPQTVNFRYRGVVNNSFSIVILPQQIIEINILQYPKLTYLYHIEDSLDLSGIRINKRYNDGVERQQQGITLGLDQNGFGWTSNQDDIDFRLLGQRQTVILSYYDYYNSDPLTISFDIEIVTANVQALYLYDPSDPDAMPDNHLGTVARGMPLNLTDKTLYIQYEGVEDIYQVPLTPSMTNYESTDRTIGIRKVRIIYGGAVLKAFLSVVDSDLVMVQVENLPKINYMLGEELDLKGGTVRRTFRYPNSQDFWTDIIPMDVEGITITGHEELQTLSESDYLPNEQYKERIVTITYRGLPYSFNIRIYKKFNARISYYSTVSFYGDVALPYATVNSDVYEFTVPNINLYFINLVDIKDNLPDGYEEDITYDEEGNIVSVRYIKGTDSFIQIVWSDGSNDIIRYIRESDIIYKNHYPETPPQNGNQYYILIRVEGNKYYNAINYARQEFRIIHKYIAVNAVVPNPNHTVWSFKVSDNGRAAFLISEYIERKLPETPGLSMYLASPTKEGFEIVIQSWGNINPNDLYNEMQNVIEQSWWSYEEIIYDGLGNPIYDEAGNIMTKIYEVQQTDMPVAGAIRKKLQIESFIERQGVNYREFGDENEYLSFYVPAGSLIPVRDSENFFILEMFEGNIVRELGNDVRYEIEGNIYNGFEIEDLTGASISGYTMSDTYPSGQPSIINPNYLISFTALRYQIAPKEIISVEYQSLQASKYTYGGMEYNISVVGYNGQQRKLEALYQTVENGPKYEFPEGEIKYYLIEDELNQTETKLARGTFPIEPGLYRARITHNYKAASGFETLIDWECLLRITN